MLRSQRDRALVAAPQLKVLCAIARRERDVIILEDDDGWTEEASGQKSVEDEGRVKGLEAVRVGVGNGRGEVDMEVEIDGERDR